MKTETRFNPVRDRVRSGIDKAARAWLLRVTPSPQTIALIKLYQYVPSARARVTATRIDTEHSGLGLSRTARVSPPIEGFELLRHGSVTCGLRWINIHFPADRSFVPHRAWLSIKNHSLFRWPGSVSEFQGLRGRKFRTGVLNSVFFIRHTSAN